MGVYYHCSKCQKTLHLTPQSPGFGQLRIKCFLCTGEALYAPSGPEANAEIVNAPSGAGIFEEVDTNVGQRPRLKGVDLRGIIGVTHDEGPSPTVPLQTPAVLLQMDAEDAAPTIPVSGLSDAQIKEFARGRSLKDAIDPTTPMQSPVGLLNAAYEAAYGPPDDPQGDSTIEQRGLPFNVPSRPISAPLAASSTAVMDRPVIPPAAMPPDVRLADEDKIPTRSVEGLSNREITAYARDLYESEPPTLDPPQIVTPPPAAPLAPFLRHAAQPVDATPPLSLRPVAQPVDPAPPLSLRHAAQPASPEALEIQTPSGLPSLADLERSPESVSALSFAEAPVGEQGGWADAARSAQADDNEPQLSPSMFTRSPLAAAEPAEGPKPAGRSSALRDRSGPSGLGPSLASEPPMTAKTGPGPSDSFAGEMPSSSSSYRRAGAGIAVVGLVFVVVFFAILGGLLLFFQNKDKAPDEGEEVSEAPEADARALRYGFDPVDPGSPFALSDTRIRLKPLQKGGDAAAFELSGTLTLKEGKGPLSACDLKATLAIDEQTLPLESDPLEPALSAKALWEPGQKRAFTLRAQEVSIKALSKPEGGRFVWLIASASGDEGDAYKGTVAEIDVDP